MMLTQIKRFFAFRPSQSLTFINNRYPLVISHLPQSLNYAQQGISLGSTLYLFGKVLFDHANLSWTGIFLRSIGGLATSFWTAQSYTILTKFVKEIHLMDDGNRIEIVTSGILGKQFVQTLDIQTIMNPDTDWRVKMYSSAIGAYTMITNDSQVFLIQKECEILDKEVFQTVIRGETIDLSEKKNLDNLIDV